MEPPAIVAEGSLLVQGLGSGVWAFNSIETAGGFIIYCHNLLQSHDRASAYQSQVVKAGRATLEYTPASLVFNAAQY